MFDNTEKKKNVIIVAVITQNYDTASLDELKDLVENIGYCCKQTIVQYRNEINLTTCVGSGKLKEIKQATTDCQAELVVFDNSLSPTQLRNIEDAIDIDVLDRTGVILQIFARRATSKEGKTQVELAQLKYLLPRLKGKGQSLSRLAGGIGTRGPGESKLETDRRHIQRRMTFLKKEIQTVSKNNNTKRRMREKSNIPQVTICGYTNAGKSTLINTLTDADVFACDMLFATLDATARKLQLPSGKEIVISDTVGFIRNIPHELVMAFKSTLDEITYSNLVLLVCDCTSNNLDTELSIVKETLQDIGYNGEIITVFNKLDKLDKNKIIPYPTKDSLYISAKKSSSIDKLLGMIDEKLSTEVRQKFKVAYDKIDIYYYFKKKNKIVDEIYMPSELLFTANANDIELKKYAEYIDFGKATKKD